MDLLGLDKTSKIILHIGGVYGDKNNSLKRFISNYKSINENIKDRLVIENDEKSYSIEDAIYIWERTGVPVVFDMFHQSIYENIKIDKTYKYIELAKKTWDVSDGRQKIHYSQQDREKAKSAHSKDIDIDDFLHMYSLIEKYDIDIMIESKLKDISGIKLHNLTSNVSLKNMQVEWSKYKYLVMEKSYKSYSQIKEMFSEVSKNKGSFKVSYEFKYEFYKLIETTLKMNDDLGNMLNTYMHLWGYFKSISSESEKNEFFRRLDVFKKTRDNLTVRRYLELLSARYNILFLLNSYFFTYK